MAGLGCRLCLGWDSSVFVWNNLSKGGGAQQTGNKEKKIEGKKKDQPSITIGFLGITHQTNSYGYGNGVHLKKMFGCVIK